MIPDSEMPTNKIIIIKSTMRQTHTYSHTSRSAAVHFAFAHCNIVITNNRTMAKECPTNK